MPLQAVNAGLQQARSLSERLDAGLRMLVLEASELQRTQLLEFLSLLVKWNGVYNLTSVRDPADMLSVHLLDALSVVHLIDRLGEGTLLDVGSGAGIPAIPLAIVRPHVNVYSIDAVAKKIGFQLQAKSTLKLANLHPIHVRVEQALLPQIPSIVVSRAFADLTKMLEAIDHLVNERTHVIAMKGRTPNEELASLPSGWIVDHLEELEVPFLGAQRCAVVLRRVSSEAERS